jgi:DNA-binding transcriptional MerR regulator/methylmalonyl-CoA mutase cobalamin-binding subunit
METLFRIRHAAKLAGISPGLLRAWERRYQLVQPKRTDSGYRVYSPEDIELLSAAVRLVGAGHSISEVARLEAGAIRQAASELGAAPALPATLPPAELPPAIRDAAIQAALQAIEQFDRERVEQALLPVLTLGGLSPAVACEELLIPLLRAIGDAWERGTMSVAAEHFGSALVRAKLLQYLQYLVRPGRGPRLVCACPEEERHEGGLLSFAVQAASAGWHIVYLGAATPFADAAETARRLDAEAVALSVTSEQVNVPALAARVKEFTTRHARPRVLLGGRRAVADREALERAGAIVAENPRLALESLLPRAAPR